VKKARVSFQRKEALVEFNEKKVNVKKMIDALNSEGYGGSLKKQ
jgi:copper chaperone CopZ